VKAAFDSLEPGAGDQLDRYLAKSAQNYEIAMREFVYPDRASLTDFLSPGLLRHARALTLLGSMEGHVAKYFQHPRLRQVMQYTLVFLGGSPANTPALYNLMSHVDFNLGVYYPEGGIGGVVDAMAALATELGAVIELDSEVKAIGPDRRGRGLVVQTEDGKIETDIVVSNTDYAHTEQALLSAEHRQFDDAYWDSRTYAPSAFMLYLGVKGDVAPLAHHTLVLPENWEPHFRTIFDEPAWPTDPAYYVCVASETDDSVAPPGHSNLFVLVPIAAGLPDTPDARAAFRDKVLGELARYTGVSLADRIVVERSFSVRDFARRYNSTHGTALGLAHTLRQTALFRPPNRSKRLPGLYYAGAYTTPGIGVPMALISGQSTARAVVADYGA
jgi:phytoene desaturase